MRTFHLDLVGFPHKNHPMPGLQIVTKRILGWFAGWFVGGTLDSGKGVRDPLRDDWSHCSIVREFVSRWLSLHHSVLGVRTSLDRPDLVLHTKSPSREFNI